jgi:hypothetical protein
MSNFFDDLGKAVTRAANSVSTEFNVAALEQRLREAYQVLGRMHYDALQAGMVAAGPEFDAQMTKINELVCTIRETRNAQNVTNV